MMKLVKLLFLLVIVAVIAAAVAAVVSRKKFEAMSDDEIRAFLHDKLADKVADEQLTSIQDAVIGGVRARSGADHHVGESDEAAGDATDDTPAGTDVVVEVTEKAADED